MAIITQLEAYEASPEKFDEHEVNFLAQIKEHGFFTTSVYGDMEGPGFSFTTGFFKTLEHPELIIFGIDPQNAHGIFSEVYASLKNGQKYPIAERTEEILDGLDTVLFPVRKSAYDEYLGYSQWFYLGDAFPCHQLVWPDTSSVFPWEDEFDKEMDGAQVDISDGGWQYLLELEKQSST